MRLPLAPTAPAIAAAAAAIAVLATASIAAAQPAPALAAPSMTAPSPDAPATAPLESDAGGRTAYLEPGAEAGITRGGFYAALELDGGYHLGDTPLWLHGRFAQGALAQIEETTMTSDFTEARVGLEARGCVLDGIACVVGGVDFGYRHEMLVTRADTDTADFAVAIARLGLDIGGEHLRVRPSIETGVQPGGWNGLGLTAGIAYTW